MALLNWLERPFSFADRFFLDTLADIDSRIERRLSRVSDMYTPNIDISEDKDNFYILAELPGLTENDVKVTVENDVLTISGQKERKEEKKERNYHRVERSFGEFIRSLSLPTNVNAKSILGTFKDGLLELTLPKIVQHTPASREIPLNVGIKTGTPNGQRKNVGKSVEESTLVEA